MADRSERQPDRNDPNRNRRAGADSYREPSRGYSRERGASGYARSTREPARSAREAGYQHPSDDAAYRTRSARTYGSEYRSTRESANGRPPRDIGNSQRAARDSYDRATRPRYSSGTSRDVSGRPERASYRRADRGYGDSATRGTGYARPDAGADRYRRQGERPQSDRYRRQGGSAAAQADRRNAQAARQATGRRPRQDQRDAFDPRSNVMGGRSMRDAGMQGARGLHLSGRPQLSSFDIADVFQLGKYILAGIVAIIIVFFIGRFIYMSSPSDFTVAGQEVSVARSTTYQDLINQGLLQAKPGDLVAVDDAVLEEGKGKPPTAYVDGNPVDDLNAPISDAGDITVQDGENEIEPYSATQKTEPIVTRVARDKQSEAEGAQVNTFNFYNGVLHVVTDEGQEGIEETRTGEVSGKTATVQVQEMHPRLFESLHPKLSDQHKYIALTFDDGPIPNEDGTPGVLQALAKYNVKGTFFMLGSEAEEYPDMAKQVVNAGHQVCTHSYSHDAKHYLNATTEDDVRYQIQTAREVVGQATGTDPRYMRPPGGNIDLKAILAADTLADGYIGWSIDPHDYELPGADAIADSIVTQAEPGAVVLLHDGGGDRSQTIAALEQAIPKLQEKGYTFVTIDEMVAAILEERGDAAVPSGDDAYLTLAGNAGNSDNADDSGDSEDSDKSEDADDSEDGE